MSSPQIAQEDSHQSISSADLAIASTSLAATGEESSQGGQSRVTADILSDDVLFEIFDWYLFQYHEEEDDYALDVEAWHTLVHVCQRWRAIVFSSQHQLDLKLYFTNGSSVQTLAVWPSLPIIVWQSYDQTQDLGNIIEALDYNDRVRDIDLTDIPSSQLEEILAVMEQPFPALTELEMGIRWQNDETDSDEVDEAAPVVPDSFLGGSAPRLRQIYFHRLPFPGLPGFLLSCTDLVWLDLLEIPDLGYFPPEAMVNCLSALTKLETLWLGFEYSQPRLYQDSLHTSQTVLPFLKKLIFKGDSGYLETLVAPIDAPVLANLEITFFHNPVFDTPQLLLFVGRTPNVKGPVEAYVDFSDGWISIKLSKALPKNLILKISCGPANSQFLSLAQVCSSSYPRDLIPTVKRLYIRDFVGPQPDLEGDTEDGQWPEFLRPFTAVEDLYLSPRFVPRIEGTLQTEMLPALQNIFFKEPRPLGAVREVTEMAVTARQLDDQLKDISLWITRWEQESEVDGLPAADDSPELFFSALDSPGLDSLSGFGDYWSAEDLSVADDSLVVEDSLVPDGAPGPEELPEPNDSLVPNGAPGPEDSLVSDGVPEPEDSLMLDGAPGPEELPEPDDSLVSNGAPELDEWFTITLLLLVLGD